MNEFQERLQELLTEHNLSRLTLAKTLGISSTTINGYFNKDYYPTIQICKSMANYFNCSLNYLLGMCDNPNPAELNNNSFMSNLNFLIKKNKLSIAKVMKDLKFSEYNYYRWNNGKFPKTSNLIDIAKYFDCSVDFLIGNTI